MSSNESDLVVHAIDTLVNERKGGRRSDFMERANAVSETASTRVILTGMGTRGDVQVLVACAHDMCIPQLRIACT